ncbi:JAB domain-containing protein [Aurantiacibacter hainanensis]|uniref:JAB domain-containing protein n=1 Tax=Aurantiacibacter hainanensis TaxID=3076114 RepID=UPI0030C72B5C
MAASREALATTLGPDHPAIDAIAAAKALVHLGFQEQLIGAPVDRGDPRLHAYLRAKLLHPSQECLFAIFMDRGGRYLGGEIASIGDANRLQVSVRSIVHRALDTEASAILLAHNHPSGDCNPSPRDITETRRLASILAAIDLALVDHLIVSSNGVFSLEKGKQL